MSDNRRAYYDHESVYRKIAENGGRGWEDRVAGDDQGSYLALDWFINSPFCPKTPQGLKALDMGCGGGQASMVLASLGFSVTGVDFSETAIELARRNAAERGLEIDFTVGDCLSLPQFPAGEFDLIVDNHVLHCIIGEIDRELFLRTARRLLKPGAIFFSETMSAEGSIDMAALRIDPETRVDARRTRYWVTANELKCEFHATGFEILHLDLRPQPDHPPPGDTIVTVATFS